MQLHPQILAVSKLQQATENVTHTKAGKQQKMAQPGSEVAKLSLPAI